MKDSAADVLGDDRVIAALSAAVHVIVPVLELLADRDPLGIKKRTFRSEDADESRVDAVLNGLAWVFDATDTPGTKSWESMSVDDRVSWWENRVGGIGTVAVAFPGMFGALARRLPLQDALAFANQTIVLVAAGREFGVSEHDEQVRMLASVLCGRDVEPADIRAQPAPSGPAVRLPRSPTALLSAMWTVTKILRSVSGELDKRPRSRTVYRWLGNVPVIGAVAGYLGERGALSRAADLAKRWGKEHVATSAM